MCHIPHTGIDTGIFPAVVKYHGKVPAGNFIGDLSYITGIAAQLGQDPPCYKKHDKHAKDHGHQTDRDNGKKRPFIGRLEPGTNSILDFFDIQLDLFHKPGNFRADAVQCACDNLVSLKDDVNQLIKSVLVDFPGFIDCC